jgi:hypothetical protein
MAFGKIRPMALRNEGRELDLPSALPNAPSELKLLRTSPGLSPLRPAAAIV